MSARERLFAYGTLRPAFAPREVAAVVASLRSLGPARVRGRLYDLGAYPGAILDASDGDFVHGEVLELPDAAPPLAWFDAYEGDAFRRARVTAELASGRILSCWAYTLCCEPDTIARIASGAWRSGGR